MCVHNAAIGGPVTFNTINTLFFQSFHSQRKIQESYSCMPGMPQIFVANTSMPQIFVAYMCMTHVSSFENGRNEKIIFSIKKGQRGNF